MSGLPPQLPPPTNPALAPILGAAVYIAGLVALWGGLSLVLDRDVVDYPDAGPLLGPAMAGCAAIITWLAAWWAVRRGRPARAAVVAALVSYFGMLATAVIGYSTGAAVQFAISPFVVAAALLSPLAVVATWAISRAPSAR